MASVNGHTGYRGGRILRITLKNFMVYKDLDFTPTPGLNLMLGVNGCGKSSIMCAICLCLGGKASDTGKKMRPADFIHGRNRFADITIELDDPGKKRNLVIKRHIESNGSSKFYVNEREVRENVIETEMRRFNIQVSNLCQFLPQEKVSDFARMNQQQLLDSMQQAVGDQAIYSNYKKLIALQNQISLEDSVLREQKEFIASEQQKNNLIRPEVDKFKEQESYKKELELLNQQLPLSQYFMQSKEVIKQKEIVESVKESIKKLDDQFADQTNVINEINQAIEKEKSCIVQCERKLAAGRSAYDGAMKVLCQLDSKIENIIDKRKSEITKAEKAEQDEISLMGQIAATEGERKHSEDQAKQLQEQINKDQERKAKIMNELEQFHSSGWTCKHKIDHLIARINGKCQELQPLKDRDRKKREYLRSRVPDVYKVMTELNQYEKRFKKKVFGPLMTLITIKHENCVKYVENHISNKDMLLFLCEDKSDAVTFVKIFREEKGLNVSSSVIPDKPLSGFIPKMSEDKLNEKYGFSGYLQGVIEADENVMAFLCNIVQIHNVPIGSSNSCEGKLDSIVKDNIFQRFYIGNTGYSIKSSRYGPNKSTTSFDIREKGIFGHTGNIQLDVLEKEIQDLTKEKDQQEGISGIIDNEIKIKSAEAEKFKELERQMKLIKSEIIECENSIIKKNKMLEALRNQKINIEQIKAEARVKLADIRVQKNKLFAQVHKGFQESVALACRKTRALVVYAYMAEKLDKYQNAMSNYNQKKCGLSEELKEERKILKELRTKMARLLENALTVNGIDINLNKEERIRALRQAYIEKFGDDASMTLDVLQDKINKVRAALACICVEDSSVYAEYQKRLSVINERETTARILEAKLNALRLDIETVKALWLTPLEGLVSKISAKFSGYFRNLNCAGEVEIVKSDDPNEFQKYGLAIRVKYRDEAPLKELSQSHHSGGERSVAVIIFILSLQELNEVPFRCVDEINQGMDSVYERRIFEFIEASAENCSQYFLLTPKLLPGLNYSKNIKIHIIQNGVGLEFQKWDLETIFENVEKLRES